MRVALVQREMLLPYRYTLAKIGHDTGMSTLRPMYYEWPMQEMAYQAMEQYNMGPSLLLSPIAAPQSQTAALWWPQNTTWQHLWVANVSVEGQGQWQNVTMPSFADVPVFARVGHTIPMRPEAICHKMGVVREGGRSLHARTLSFCVL